MPERPFPLITEDFLGFKSSIHTWNPFYTLRWLKVAGFLGVFSGFQKHRFPHNHLFNQPHLRRTVGHNHILFSQWGDPRSSDSGPYYVILAPFYHCDGPILPFFPHNKWYYKICTHQGSVGRHPTRGKWTLALLHYVLWNLLETVKWSGSTSTHYGEISTFFVTYQFKKPDLSILCNWNLIFLININVITKF